MALHRDSFYTPPYVAELLTRSIRTRSVNGVLDLACGDGALLAAAAERFVKAKLYGCDVRAAATRQIRAGGLKRLRVIRLNSVAEFDRLRSWIPRGGVDVVLLNPPFSARKKKTVRLGGQAGSSERCSLAAAFLSSAVDCVRVGGMISAIMPASFVHSERDANLRRALSRLGELRTHESFPKEMFLGANATTVLVTFVRRLRRRVEVVSPVVEPPITVRAEIVRGGVQVHRLGPKDFQVARFAHTTELNSGRVASRLARVPVSARSIRGPAVLLPRVGGRAEAKVSCYDSSSPLVLSDCVIGIQYRSRIEARHAAQLISAHWRELFPNYYRSTGAPYMTLADVSSALAQIASWSRNPSFVAGSER